MQRGNVYTEKAISVATYFGGPLIAGYLISENFKLFKKEELVRKTLLGSIAFFVAYIELIYLIPDEIVDKIPDLVFPLFYTSIAYILVHSTQSRQIVDALIDFGYFQAADQ